MAPSTSIGADGVTSERDGKH